MPTSEEIQRRLGASEPLTLQELYRSIWRGSLPAIALNDALDRDLFYSSYVQTYLQRDVRSLARVGDELAFLRFLRAAAARTAQLLNVTELARDADVAPNTAKHWLSILQATDIIYLLEPYHSSSRFCLTQRREAAKVKMVSFAFFAASREIREVLYHSNLSKRLVKTPKLYLLDTGLAAYLTEWASPQTLEAGAMSGAILESWVVAELLKGYWHHGKRAPFFYYRDKDQKEVDLLIVQDGMAYPLEIKKSASPGKADVRHFAALERLGLPLGPGGVICLAEQALPLTASAWSIPVRAL